MKAGSGKMPGIWETAESSVRKVSSFPFFSTGSGAIDGFLRGGFRAGRLTELFGKSNSGKSQLAMQTALVAAKNGARSLFIDTEGSFRPERLEEMAEARRWEARDLLERIVYVRSDSSSEQIETVRRLGSRPATSDCRLVVVDTLTRNFSVELPGRSNLSSRQAALNVHLSEMSRDAYLNGRAYLLANRVTFGATRDVGIGGRTVGQLVHESLMMERDAGRMRITRIPTGESVAVTMGAAGVG